MPENNMFGDDEQQVKKVVVRARNLDGLKNVRRISDPAPRPEPLPLDSGRRVDEWTPKVKASTLDEEKLEEKVVVPIRKLGGVLFGVATMALIGYAVFWVISQYS